MKTLQDLQLTENTQSTIKSSLTFAEFKKKFRVSEAQVFAKKNGNGLAAKCLGIDGNKPRVEWLTVSQKIKSLEDLPDPMVLVMHNPNPQQGASPTWYILCNNGAKPLFVIK